MLMKTVSLLVVALALTCNAASDVDSSDTTATDCTRKCQAVAAAPVCASGKDFRNRECAVCAKQTDTDIKEGKCPATSSETDKTGTESTTATQCKEKCHTVAEAPVCAHGQDFRNRECAVCAKQTDAAISEGKCATVTTTDCRTECSNVAEEPVCANGRTFRNKECARCAKQTDVTDGKCTTDTTVTCEKKCEGAEKVPVCGSDGKTYRNKECVSCNAGITVTVRGECKVTTDCRTSCADEANAPVCSNGRTYSNACSAKCAGVIATTDGECKRDITDSGTSDCACTKEREYAPFCGSDGMTYSGECVAKCAGVSGQGGFLGKCNEFEDAAECKCESDDKRQVCASGVTYGNKCFAHCARALDEKSYAGACKEETMEVAADGSAPVVTDTNTCDDKSSYGQECAEARDDGTKYTCQKVAFFASAQEGADRFAATTQSVGLKCLPVKEKESTCPTTCPRAAGTCEDACKEGYECQTIKVSMGVGCLGCKQARCVLAKPIDCCTRETDAECTACKLGQSKDEFCKANAVSGCVKTPELASGVWKRACHTFCGNTAALTVSNACGVCDYAKATTDAEKEKCGSICTAGTVATAAYDGMAEESNNGKLRKIVERAQKLLADGTALTEVIALVREELGAAEMTAAEITTAIKMFIDAAKKEVESAKGLIKMCDADDAVRHVRGRRDATEDTNTKPTTEVDPKPTAEDTKPAAKPERVRPEVVGVRDTDAEVVAQKTRPEVTRAATSKCTLDEISEFTLTLENNQKVYTEAVDFAATFAASSMGSGSGDGLDDLLTNAFGSGAASCGSVVTMVVAAFVATIA